MAVVGGKSDEARQLVLDALDLDDTSVAAWSLRARLSRNPGEIRSTWERVLTLAPGHPEARAYPSWLSSALSGRPVSPKPVTSRPRQRHALISVPTLSVQRLAFVAMALGGGSLIKYILRRLLILPVTMFVVTSILFFVILQLPAEERVKVYVPAVNPHLEPEEYTDSFMAFPVMAAAMVMVALYGGISSNSLPDRHMTLPSLVEPYLLVTLVLFGWMPYARLLRGNVVAERKKEYIQSAFSVGVPNRRILFRHLLPNVTRGLFVLITSDIGAVVVLVAVFNFLGLTGGAIGGALADWGEMLRLNRDWIITPSNAFEYWYTFLPPSLAIVFFAMGWSLIGDGLRDVLDPRLR